MHDHAATHDHGCGGAQAAIARAERLCRERDLQFTRLRRDVLTAVAGQTRPMWDFEDIGDWWTRADPKGIFPIIAVPTTAGTGSEVGRAGVITDETTHTKKVIFHPLMMPKVVIADPELTVGMPQFITVGTGMDALAHCLEAYCAPGYHPLADGIAVEGIRLVFENLPKVYANPNDVEARGHMMSAAAMTTERPARKP